MEEEMGEVTAFTNNSRFLCGIAGTVEREVGYRGFSLIRLQESTSIQVRLPTLHPRSRFNLIVDLEKQNQKLVLKAQFFATFSNTMAWEEETRVWGTSKAGTFRINRRNVTWERTVDLTQGSIVSVVEEVLAYMAPRATLVDVLLQAKGLLLSEQSTVDTTINPVC